jgi:putative holliday junction resolvase
LRRALGIDLGQKRIGIAVCDDAGRLAIASAVVARVGDRTVEHGRILELAAQLGAHYLVVGLPRSLDGSEGPAAGAIRSEIRGLNRRIRREGLDLVVEEQDERLTTAEAHRNLQVAGHRSRDRRQLVDASAAAIILQSWLDAGGGVETDA